MKLKKIKFIFLLKCTEMGTFLKCSNTRTFWFLFHNLNCTKSRTLSYVPKNEHKVQFNIFRRVLILKPWKFAEYSKNFKLSELLNYMNLSNWCHDIPTSIKIPVQNFHFFSALIRPSLQTSWALCSSTNWSLVSLLTNCSFFKWMSASAFCFLYTSSWDNASSNSPLNFFLVAVNSCLFLLSCSS